MKARITLSLLLLAMFGSVVAQTAPAPAPTPTPKMTEVSKLRVLNCYRKAVIAQAQAAAAQKAFNDALAEFSATTEREAKELGFPEGTRFDVSKADSEEVTPVLPEKKADEKLPAKK